MSACMDEAYKMSREEGDLVSRVSLRVMRKQVLIEKEEFERMRDMWLWKQEVGR